ncbi:MAG: AzlC family ABC transporter permease [Anaerolineales bacterium]|nr:AzlC family ABC transporter permease [Anaerolineales bacterium]
MEKHLAEFFKGARAMLPVLVGVIPFAMIYAVLALDAGLTPGQSQAMSAIVFAGSAQIVMTQLVRLDTPGLVIILTVGIINLRHVLYSASMAPYLQPLKRGWKWLLAYLLTDEAYVVTAVYYQNSEPVYSESRAGQGGAPAGEAGNDIRYWFLFGAGFSLWLSWQLSTAAGIFLGAVLPTSWSLDFTLALTFIALVVPNLRDRASVAAALAAGLIAVLAFNLPYKLGLMIAMLAGIGLGLWVEGRE